MENKIQHIIPVDKLNKLMEKFTIATGMGSAVIDLKGNIISGAGWQDICTKFHRIHPETKKNCIESDIELANQLGKNKSYNAYHCKNGMIDVAVPIIIQGKHLANVFIGQFFFEKPDTNFFRKQAKKYGFNETEYLDALKKVPVRNEEEVKKIISFLQELANMISEMGYSKMKMNSFQENLEKQIEERTKELKYSQIATLNILQDAEEARANTEKLNEDLKRSNKELEQFAYVASHDLQEPLRKVASFTDLLENRLQDKLGDKEKKFMHYITDGANRMQQLINDLLVLSRIETRGARFTHFSSEKTLKAVLNTLQLRIEKSNAQIKFKNLPRIYGDQNQIEMIFQNLIANAIKFCPEERKPVIQIQAKPEGKNWHFSISDNGIGIAKEYHERIFIIFQRLHSKTAYSGTGIGLAICKKVIDRHSGKIWVESELDKGSTFHFILPMH